MYWPNDKNAIQKAFDDDGFVIVRQLYSSTEVVDLQGQLDRYVDQIVPGLPPMDAFFEDWETRRQIRMLSRMERHDSHFRELLTTGLLPEIAGSLSSTKVIPHDAAYFNKVPIVGDATPPHQDGFYFQLEPCNALTLWVALDQVDKENGCIHYVRGSHRRGMRQHGRSSVLRLSQGIVDYGRAEDALHEVAACVSPGDVIVHHAMTIHRTDPNPCGSPATFAGSFWTVECSTQAWGRAPLP